MNSQAEDGIATERRQAKARFKALVEAVTKAVNDDDPIGLLRLGMPSDEYSLEVGTVVPRLSHATNVDDVKRILHEEFVRWFAGSAGSEEAYTELAQRVWEALLEHRRAP